MSMNVLLTFRAPIIFDERTPDDQLRGAAGMGRARIDLQIEENGIAYCFGWYARYFWPYS